MPLSAIWVVSPLTADVATMTKTNEVTKVIGFCGIGEVGKTNNVMYVKFLPVFSFIDAALLAGVIVALSCAAALAFPGCAVITLVIAALPVVMVCAAVPLVSAVSRAKAKSPCALEGSRNHYVLTALFALIFGGSFCGRLGRHETAPPRLLVAFARAYSNHRGPMLKRLSLKCFVANLASVTIVVLLELATKFIRTFTATSGLPTIFQALRISEIGLVTVGARSFNHGHIIA